MKEVEQNRIKIICQSEKSILVLAQNGLYYTTVTFSKTEKKTLLNGYVLVDDALSPLILLLLVFFAENVSQKKY